MDAFYIMKATARQFIFSQNEIDISCPLRVPADTPVV
jgi:hypothetical protein